MEGDHRVWPPEPGPGHRRTPPGDTEPARDEERHRVDRPPELGWGRPPDPAREPSQEPGWGRSPNHAREQPPEPGRGRPPEPPPGWGRRGRPYAAGTPQDPGRARAHPLDLEEPAWNPRIRPVPDRGHPTEAWEDLPPSARLHGSPADPKPPRGRHVGGTRRRVTMALVALAAGAGLVTGTTAVTLWLTTPQADTGNLSDALAGVRATLPDGWSTGPVAPVTGFTSVVRDGQGGLVMARPVPGPIPDAEQATADAAELYSRLLLKGDRVSVVEDRQIPGGHTRAIRAEYSDVVNRPAYLRVMLLTRANRPVLLVGLLQPEQNNRRQALDAVMTSLR